MKAYIDKDNDEFEIIAKHHHIYHKALYISHIDNIYFYNKTRNPDYYLKHPLQKHIGKIYQYKLRKEKMNRLK